MGFKRSGSPWLWLQKGTSCWRIVCFFNFTTTNFRNSAGYLPENYLNLLIRDTWNNEMTVIILFSTIAFMSVLFSWSFLTFNLIVHTGVLDIVFPEWWCHKGYQSSTVTYTVQHLINLKSYYMHSQNPKSYFQNLWKLNLEKERWKWIMNSALTWTFLV